MVGPQVVAEGRHTDHVTLLHQRVHHDTEETVGHLLVIVH